MSLDPRTPVLVGAAAIEQRMDDPTVAREAVALMTDALRAAAEDAGAPELLGRAGLVHVPRGIWHYSDPGRIIADRLGAGGARTELAEVGVLQTTLFGRATTAIERGDADVCLIAGGEAKYRDLLASKRGLSLTDTVQTDVAPDAYLEPHTDVLFEPELLHGIAMPVMQYSMLENALRAADGQSLEAHRADVAALWADFSAVAADNPHAWYRDAVSAEDLAAESDTNRPLAFPYTKRHVSQWNVDQAAGLILCAVETARELGVPEDRWVFPWAVTESNHMVPVSTRPDLHRSHGFAVAGERAATLAGVPLADAAHLELYSCFPVAVRQQLREFGLPADRRCTESGGMPFAGGPLNNFVLQAMARMVEILRADPGSLGLVTAISGMLTKQGVTLWSTARPERACTFEDVTPQSAPRTPTLPFVSTHEGPGTIASYTVLYDGGTPSRAVLVCDLPSGERTLATVADAGALTTLMTSEGCGLPIRIAGQRATLA